MTRPELQRRGPRRGLLGLLLLGFCAVLALGSLGASDPAFTSSVATPGQRPVTSAVAADRQHRFQVDGNDPAELLRHRHALPAVLPAALLLIGIGLVLVGRWQLPPIRRGRLLPTTAAPRGPPSFC